MHDLSELNSTVTTHSASGRSAVAGRMSAVRCVRSVAAIAILLAVAAPAETLSANDVVTKVTFVADDESTRHVEGKVLVTAADGGLLILGRDGQLWNVTPDRLRHLEQTGRPFQPLTADELGERLLVELGEPFEIVRTRHYVVCSNAGRLYARWCGALFERLLRSFQSYWRSRGFDVHEPELPLAAIVFANSEQFAEFAERDAGKDASTAKGYYSIRTNRVVLYDLTAGPHSRPARSVAEINSKAMALPFNVATVVHEATHQIAFNCGLHTRYADNPLWLTEGMAMYFETPDLRSRSGWRSIGKINRTRFERFRDYQHSRRKIDSLAALIGGNDRFVDAATIEDAYAESWAVTYFFIKTRPDEYVEYLKRVSLKPRLVWDTRESRLREFQAVFGDDLEQLDSEFLDYLKRRGRR